MSRGQMTSHGRRGACLWFTGLSGAGKTTTADALVPVLEQHGRTVTVLDGDVVRTHISKGLGFSREDRDTQVRRVGFVSAEIVRHGGLVICSLVSPYRSTRDEVREMVDAVGGPGSFIEVYVDAPLDEVMRRDVKGWYAAADRGEVKNMTGVSDPYEPPFDPELHLNTVERSVDDNVAAIVTYLEGHAVL